MGQIILASASPRRKELLEQIGISFEICPAKGEERITKSVPHEVVEELASQKAIEVASMVRTYEETHQELVTPSDLMVIGADTIVSCGGQILGKPKDERDACHMLARGRRDDDFDTAGTQFFVVHKDAPKLDGRYAAFGEMESGFEVLDAIASQPTYGPETWNKPVKMPVITRIVIED